MMNSSSFSSATSFSPSLPLPSPRTPPRHPDLCGKFRKQVEIKRLQREIGFLEEELHSLDGLQLASTCCKEVDEFVGTKPDPLIPLNRKIHRSFRIWKIFRGKSCFNFSWIWCSGGCSLHLRKPKCACYALKNLICCCCGCLSCCCSCSCSNCCCCCCKRSNCKPRCCVLPTLSCPDCTCSCVWSCPTCRNKCCSCPKCTKNCCLPCSLCC